MTRILLTAVVGICLVSGVAWGKEPTPRKVALDVVMVVVAMEEGGRLEIPGQDEALQVGTLGKTLVEKLNSTDSPDAVAEAIQQILVALDGTDALQALTRLQLTTIDGQRSSVQVNRRVPRIVGASTNSRGSSNTVSMAEVGAVVAVTTRIDEEDTIMMEVSFEKCYLGPEETGAVIAVRDGETIRSPSIEITTVQSTLSAKSGQAVLLGGSVDKREGTVIETLVVVVPRLAK